MAEQDRLHVITMQEVQYMQKKIKEFKKPKLLNLTAGRESCCIFRVPQTLVDINKKAYHPQILSIGPYHHGKPHLNMIEEHKWRFLGELLRRIPPNGLQLVGYLNIIAPLETRIRDCYSEFIHFSSFDLLQMMVLDGLFIIELISKAANVAPSDPNDPIFIIGWVWTFIARDLLQLENQIPFFVLQTLFENTRVTRSSGDDQTLAKLIFGFFNNVVKRSDEHLQRFENQEGKHLLDLFRLSFIPQTIQPTLSPLSSAWKWAIRNAKGRLTWCSRAIPCYPNPTLPDQDFRIRLYEPTPDSRKDIESIPSAKKLDTYGIKFKGIKGDTFLEIRFRKGVLEIPKISIDDFITRFFLNSVAFEQCYRYCSKHMTTYTGFMKFLIRSPSDAGFLGDREIMENYFGSDKELAHFFNDLGKEVSFDISYSYLSAVFKDVDEYHRNKWHVYWARLKSTYFNTPWSFIPALAAFVLLLLTMIQAFYAFYSYTYPKTSDGVTGGTH